MTCQRIAPILNSLAETFANAATSVSTGPLCPEMLAEMLTCSSRILQQLAPIVSELAKAEEEQSFALAGINDIALELLWSLDASSQHYTPRTPAEIVALLHDLLEVAPDTNDPDSNVMPVNFRKEAGQ